MDKSVGGIYSVMNGQVGGWDIFKLHEWRDVWVVYFHMNGSPGGSDRELLVTRTRFTTDQHTTHNTLNTSSDVGV